VFYHFEDIMTGKCSSGGSASKSRPLENPGANQMSRHRAEVGGSLEWLLRGAFVSRPADKRNKSNHAVSR
jgi:hypothetical protein